MLKAKHHTIPFILIYFSLHISVVTLRLDKQRLDLSSDSFFMAQFLQKLKWKFDFFPVWVKLVQLISNSCWTCHESCLGLRLLLTQSVKNLWWKPMYIWQVSSQVQRCSLDLVRTTELRIFNELNVYRVQ